MPVSRYKKNGLVRTAGIEYRKILEKREANFVDHFSFEPYKILKVKDVENLDIINHTWVPSDRFFKLSSKYYGSPTYWWIIAYYNGTPLETDVEIGQIIEIPTPLPYILAALEY